MIRYSISKEYSDTLGARYVKQSLFSGEHFRNTVLIPLYNKAKLENTKLFIDLDDTYGYPPSFLEEAFGGLARAFPNENVLTYLEFKSDDQPSVIEEISRDIKNAIAGKSQ